MTHKFLNKEMIKELPYPPEQIRKEMLSREDQERILKRKGDMYRKDGTVYVVKYLTVITTLKDN